MSFSWTRVGAILCKELRDYQHNRFVIGTMAATPALFIILPAPRRQSGRCGPRPHGLVWCCVTATPGRGP